MLTHELAQKLLALPNVPVYTRDDGNSGEYAETDSDIGDLVMEHNDMEGDYLVILQASVHLQLTRMEDHSPE